MADVPEQATMSPLLAEMYALFALLLTRKAAVLDMAEEVEACVSGG